mgnify:CR=1 FL=1
MMTNNDVIVNVGNDYPPAPVYHTGSNNVAIRPHDDYPPESSKPQPQNQ